MSTFGGIYVAYSGVTAHRRRIETIGENIANVDTPGYHRQRVVLSPASSEATGFITGRLDLGGGVTVDDVTRLRNAVLETHARIQAGVAADRGITADSLAQIEDIVGGLADGGLRDQTAEFLNSFDDLASAPDDPALRRIVLQRGENVAQAFTRTASALDALRQQVQVDTADAVSSINQLTGQIAALDTEISNSINAEVAPNALLDKRDLKVAELSSLADFKVIELSDGKLSISLDGQLLVGNGQSSPIGLAIQPDAGLAALGYDKMIVVSDDGRELRIGSGKLAANLSVMTSVIPDARLNIEAVATSLVGRVNTLHQGGFGIDLSTGLDFFDHDPVTGEVTLSASVAGQPDSVAASSGTGDLDNTNARTIAHLAEAADGPLSVLAEMVGALGIKVSTAASSAEAAAIAGEQAANLALADGGVSLDEELTDLISAQRSYEASARLLTAIDEMLQTLMTTGLVGR